MRFTHFHIHWFWSFLSSYFHACMYVCICQNNSGISRETSMAEACMYNQRDCMYNRRGLKPATFFV